MLRAVYHWFFRYPVIGGVISLFFWIVSFNGLSVIGLPDLFWRKSGHIAFSAGLGVALVFDIVIYISYLLEAETLGHSIWWYGARTYPLLLAVFVVGFFRNDGHRLAMFFGWLTGAIVLLLIGRGLDAIADRLAQHVPRGKTAQRFLLRETARVDLHMRAFLVMAILVLAWLFFNIVPFAFRWIVAPFAISMLLTFIVLTYGWPYFQFPKQRLVLTFVFVVAIALANLRPYRYRYPNLDSLYDGPPRPPSHQGAIQLLPDSLDNWSKQFAAKPRLVVVATSGGGIRAAVWTSVVLRRLSVDPKLPDFIRHVRIITGASGGMAGAADFIATFDPAKPPAPIGGVEDDALDDVARSLALRDAAKLVLPLAFPDRGVALERRWEDLSPKLKWTFGALRDGEKSGWRPSLIFTPTLVEDGRRLVVSNLELNDVAGGVQLFHIFPEAYGKLHLATAARMSATFPYVSPAAELPLSPRRHIVDAGYYDTYGPATAVAWIAKNRDAIKAQTSGVALIQIRDSAIDADAHDVDSPRAAAGVALFSELLAPVFGVINVVFSSDVFRNDQSIAHVTKLFDPGFMQTFTFENRAGSQPLSWALTDDQRATIHKRFDDPAVAAARMKLEQWW
jgi:Patatin-like phospholipase